MGLGLAGCGADPRPARAPQPEKSTIDVGIMPILDAAPYFVAEQQGLFDRHGLRVRTTLIAGGEQGIPELGAGKLDVAFSNYVTVVKKAVARTPTRVVAAGAAGMPGTFGVVVLPDTPAYNPPDLAGTRIGVNTLDNIATLLVHSAAQTGGLDPNQYELVPIPFPKMTGALQDGTVDAAFLPAPLLTQAQLKLGTRTVLEPITGGTRGLPIDGYVTDPGFADHHPNTVAAFRHAIEDATARIPHHHVSLAKKLAPMLHTTTRAFVLSAFPKFADSLSAARLQRVPDLMASQGLVTNGFRMKRLIADHAT